MLFVRTELIKICQFPLNVANFQKFSSDVLFLLKTMNVKLIPIIISKAVQAENSGTVGDGVGVEEGDGVGLVVEVGADVDAPTIVICIGVVCIP